MTTSSTNVVAKIAAVVAGLGLVAMAFAPAAKADATSDLQAQIASLLAQIASLQAQLGTSTTTTTATFTTDLTVGSKGASVTALQNWLISKGFTIAAGATGTFGAQTKAALAAYQASVGISPAAGYFGPVTRAKVNASSSTSTTTTTTTTTTGPLSGGEGSIDNFKILGATNTALNAADSDTVYGFEFKAGGSDLATNRVDFDVYKSAGTGSTRPWNIFSKAVLMKGSATVATVDASNMNNWSEDGTMGATQQYRLRFDGLNDVTKQGNTADYYLVLYTANSISTSNAGTGTVFSVSLASQGLRAVDAKGIQQYTTSGTSYNTVSISGSSTGSLTVSTGADNPQTTTVQGSSNTQTSGVTLTTFTLQAKDTDLMVYTLPVTVATTSATASSLVRSLKLYQGSTLVDTESFASASSNTITFKNLDVKVAAGTTQTFSVKADISAIDGVTVPEGSSISASIPATGWDVTNTAGDQVTPTGSVTGNVVTFRSIGLTVDSTPASETATKSVPGTGTQETGTFTITFNVTAFGQDVYVSSTTNGFTPLLVLDQSGVATTTAAASITSTADRTTTGTNNYVIHSGQTKSVTVSYTKLGQAGYAYARLLTLKFGTTDANPLASSTSFTTNFQTPQIYLAD